ncbi:MAG TPA: hypothetical protein VH165_15630, partial [Kofleriaceae bacterium]|nr:hypothetical protein [Kofleriaceae bacterium]
CQHTFKICGLTTSFSPFVVASGTQMTSTFQQTTYSGPSGPIQSLTVPADAVYHIIANGATGGKATTGTTKSGGCGAHITGDFALHQGDVLQVLVGQQGTSTAQNGGGGGGTFVALNGAPLIVAGGGGGIRTGATVNGLDGSTTSTGGTGSTSADHTTGLVLGGTGGLGGKHAAGFGAGGGGWSGNGEADGVLGEGGWAFLATGANQGKGGVGKTCGTLANGGFGGGGAGNGCFGGGGGGGYSGGGGGRVAGGGGSWNTGANPTAGTRCTANGQGFLMITPPSTTP